MTYTLQCNKFTHNSLDIFLEQQRHLWNAALDQRIEAYRKKRLFLSFFDQCKQLTELRQSESDFNSFHLQSQRSILNRLHKAFQNFFRRVKNGENPGFPRFKGKHRRINSFDIPDPIIKTVNNRRVIIIKGIGKFRFKAESLENMKSAKLIKTPRRLKLQLLIDQDVPEKHDTRNTLGIDVGIKSQITLSNGIQSEGRKRDLQIIKKRQQILAKATKSSINRQKKKLLLAKAWQRLRESEKGYLHRLTRELVNKYSSKYFIEDLKIKNMVKNRRLARSIHEQMWGTFYSLLTYKAEDAGGWIKRVNPKNTSQRCCQCHHLPLQKIGLEVRTYECESCGNTINRDINAAKNVLQIGLSNLPGGKLSESPGVFGEGRLQPALAG